MSYGEKYVTSLYWSFTTMCTVGYGDVTPALHRRAEMAWAMVTQLVGATVFAYSISSMVDLLALIDLPEKLRKQEMRVLRDYLATLSWGPKKTSRYRLMKTIRRVYTQVRRRRQDAWEAAEGGGRGPRTVSADGADDGGDDADGG